MQKVDMFLAAIDTLFWSGGSEPMPEIIWGANDLLDWFEAEYDVKLNMRFTEDCENYKEVVAQIQNVLR